MRTSSRSSNAAPCSAVSAPPAPPSTRATSVAKCQPPASTSAAGPSAIITPCPISTTRSANSAANSVSCVATSTAAPDSAASRLSRRASASLRRASIPRVGSSRHDEREPPPVEHQLEREPLALAAGEVARVRVDARAEPRRGDRPRPRLVAHVLVDR